MSRLLNINWLLASVCLLGATGLFLLSQDPSASAASCKGAEALAEGCPLSSKKVSPYPRNIKPNGRGAERNKQICQGGLRTMRGMKEVCQFGASTSRAKATFALIGDSHAAQWRPALNWVAKRRSLRIISLTASSCDYIDGDQFKRSEGQKWQECKRFRRQVPKFLARSPEISGVIFSSVSQEENRNIVGYQRAWEKLPDSVQRIAVIRDNPRTNPGAHDCIIKAVKAGRSPAVSCSYPRSQALRSDSQLKAAQQLQSPNVAPIDLSDLFCDQKRCYPVVGGVLVYQDGNHQTAQFNRTLAPYLLKELQANWPDL